jgi:serine/threonine protein kinase
MVLRLWCTAGAVGYRGSPCTPCSARLCLRALSHLNMNSLYHSNARLSTCTTRTQRKKNSKSTQHLSPLPRHRCTHAGVATLRGTLPWIAPEVIKSPSAVTEAVVRVLGVWLWPRLWPWSWPSLAVLLLVAPRLCAPNMCAPAHAHTMTHSHTPPPPPTHTHTHPPHAHAPRSASQDVYSFGIVLWELWCVARRQPRPECGQPALLSGASPRATRSASSQAHPSARLCARRAQDAARAL